MTWESGQAVTEAVETAACFRLGPQAARTAEDDFPQSSSSKLLFAQDAVPIDSRMTNNRQHKSDQSDSQLEQCEASTAAMLRFASTGRGGHLELQSSSMVTGAWSETVIPPARQMSADLNRFAAAVFPIR